ncbi:MAG: dihydroorotase [Thermoanaerobaculia bacterium]
MKLLIKGGRVVDPSRGVDEVVDLLVEDGFISQLGGRVRRTKSLEVFDASGLVVCPGLIDMHVHFREPGQEYKETIGTGLSAAAAGGFTAVACMANTDPVNDSRSVTEHMVAEAARYDTARLYPIGAVTKGLQGKELSEVGDMAEAGVVALSDDGLPVVSSELMRRAIEYSQHFDLVVIQHAEDLDLGAGGVMHEGEFSTRTGLPGLPGAAEDVMVARDLILLEDFGGGSGRYHVAHLSTARSLDLVRGAKNRGLNVSCEVTPHHLLLTDREVWSSHLSTDTKMKPPLRADRDREALLEGIADGSIDAIASDHAPHHADEKDVQYSCAPFGIVGLETTLSLCLDGLVRPGVIDLPRLIELLSTAPARILGVPGGTLAEGALADVSVLSLKSRTTINPLRFSSKSRNTPFRGWKLTGRPVTTFLGGRQVT